MNTNDMYYNPYAYGNPFQAPPYNTYTTSGFNDIKERLNRLERQTKRLEQRLSRLENPYTNKINNTEPDNNMYIM